MNIVDQNKLDFVHDTARYNRSVAPCGDTANLSVTFCSNDRMMSSHLHLLSRQFFDPQNVTVRNNDRLRVGRCCALNGRPFSQQDQQVLDPTSGR